MSIPGWFFSSIFFSSFLYSSTLHAGSQAKILQQRNYQPLGSTAYFAAVEAGLPIARSIASVKSIDKKGDEEVSDIYFGRGVGGNLGVLFPMDSIAFDLRASFFIASESGYQHKKYAAGGSGYYSFQTDSSWLLLSGIRADYTYMHQFSLRAYDKFENREDDIEVDFEPVVDPHFEVRYIFGMQRRMEFRLSQGLLDYKAKEVRVNDQVVADKWQKLQGKFTSLSFGVQL